MQRHNNSARDAYVLVRVFRVSGRDVGMRFFPNPWSLQRDGALSLGPLSDDGYHRVTIN